MPSCSHSITTRKKCAPLYGWGGDAVACELAAASTDPADQQRLIAAATAVNGVGCTGASAPTGTDTGTTTEEATNTEGGNNLLLPLLLLALLALLGGAIWYVYNRRQDIMSEAQSSPAPSSARPTTASPTTTSAQRPSETTATTYAEPVQEYEPVAVPIARFRTNYPTAMTPMTTRSVLKMPTGSSWANVA
ncbi:MAG: hypothetical protein R3C44_11875 [Chloroflexota bacterium]